MAVTPGQTVEKHQKLNRLLSKKAHTKTEKSVLTRCYGKQRMRLHHATAAPGKETKKLKMLEHICRNDPSVKNILKKAPMNSKKQTNINPSQNIDI